MKKYLLIIVCALMAFVGNAEAYAEKLALKKPIKIRINSEKFANQ